MEFTDAEAARVTAVTLADTGPAPALFTPMTEKS
jgi:hypothetical protein